MRARHDPRQTTAVLVGIISIAGLLLVGNGTPSAAVTDVLAVVLPPLIAIAAQAEWRK